VACAAETIRPPARPEVCSRRVQGAHLVFRPLVVRPSLMGLIKDVLLGDSNSGRPTNRAQSTNESGIEWVFVPSTKYRRYRSTPCGAGPIQSSSKCCDAIQYGFIPSCTPSANSEGLGRDRHRSSRNGMGLVCCRGLSSTEVGPCFSLYRPSMRRRGKTGYGQQLSGQHCP
jgi:hypothetical protein